MRKIIPEKMVEIWTAHAILRKFGSLTRIWAPTLGVDQMVAPIRGKRFLVELKAPKWQSPYAQSTEFPSAESRPAKAQPVEIDIGQLLEYHEMIDLEVIYVLPQPKHYLINLRNVKMPLESFIVRNAFPDWAYVICSSQLLKLIKTEPELNTMLKRSLPSGPNASSKDRGLNGRFQRGKYARVVCDLSNSIPRVFHLDNGVRGSGVNVISLSNFLTLLNKCPFDRPLVVRSSNLPRSTVAAIPAGLRPTADPFGQSSADDAIPIDDSDRAVRFRRLPGRLLVVEVVVPMPPRARS